MTPKQSKKPVAGYFRISKARDEAETPDMYEHQIRDYCKYRGLELADIFSDIDYSGRRGAKPRPGLEGLLERRQEFAVVVAPKLSRFGRSLRDLAELFAMFDDDGIGLVFLDVEVDTRTSTGRLVRNIMATLAEYESDLISDRWRDTYRYIARQGRATGGTTVPLGYRYDKDKRNYVIEPSKAKVVRELFRCYRAGDSLKSIAADLTERKIPNRKGSRWWPSTLAGMIENPAYAALRPYDGELIQAAWSPIIPRREWEEAVALRKAQKAVKKPPREGTGKYLLSSLFFCGKCGGRVYRRTWAPEHNKPAMYACATSLQFGKSGCDGGAIKAERAEQIVVEEFFEKVSTLHRQHLQKMSKRAIRAEAGLTGEKKSRRDPEKELRDIDRQIERLVASTLEDIGPGAARAVRQKLEELEQGRSAIETEATVQEGRELEAQRMVDQVEELRELAADLPSVWQSMTVQERREALSLFVERVVLVPGKKPKTVRVEWVDWLGQRA